MGPGARAQRIHDGHLVFSGLDLGNVLVAIQPPRGFGDDPVAVYHSPDLPPAHHYLAFYRWLDEGWGADAVVHLGKHGTLEWLPGQGARRCPPAAGPTPPSATCRSSTRSSSTTPARAPRPSAAPTPSSIDHLLPPMTRADTYDELARLEQLLDEYAQVQALDPSKLPALREPDLGRCSSTPRSTATSASTTRPTTTSSTT